MTARKAKTKPETNHTAVTETVNQNDNVVTQTVKRKRNRDFSNWGQEFIEPGDNTRYIKFAMQSMNLPKLDFNDVPSVQKRIEWYFTRCMDADMKPGVVGLANALGVDRKTLWEWKTGGRREANKALADTIKKAYSTLEEMWEFYMQNGKISPPNGIFLGKNNFDYKDVQDVVVTPNTPLQVVDAEAAKDTIINALPESEE